MSEGQPENLKNLIELSRIDGAKARAEGELDEIGRKRSEQVESLARCRREMEDSKLAWQTRKDAYTKEERLLKEATEKLVMRRKTLASLGDYKTQLAAEREIDSQSRQISAQEEMLIQTLSVLEELDSDFQGKKERFDTQEKETADFLEDAKANEERLQEKIASLQSERADVLKRTNDRDKKEYERVVRRHPLDAVVAINGSNCGGCFMNLGPQIVMRAARSTELVRCQGCMRILYIDHSKQDGDEAAN